MSFAEDSVASGTVRLPVTLSLSVPSTSPASLPKQRSASLDQYSDPFKVPPQRQSSDNLYASDGSFYSVKTFGLTARSESSLSQYFSLETLLGTGSSLSLDDPEVNRDARPDQLPSVSTDSDSYDSTVDICDHSTAILTEMSSSSPEKVDPVAQPQTSPAEKKKKGGIRLSFKRKKQPKAVTAPTNEIVDDATKLSSESDVANSPDSNTSETVTPPNSPDEITDPSGPVQDTPLPVPDTSEPGKGSLKKTEELSIAEELEDADKKEALQSTSRPKLSTVNPAQAGANTGKREHLYKILVIGELGAGKTSIIKRYVHQFFSQHYRATIGVDFALKVINWDEDTVVRLQLWDIAGQERFGNMTRVYYKEAVGAFIVFDVTRSNTFDAIIKWKRDLDSKVCLPNGGPIPVVLLANKCDQTKEGVVSKPEEMEKFCKEHEFCGWFETSAKENINIEQSAQFLVTKILRFEKEGLMINETVDGSKFSVRTDPQATPPSKSKSKCAC